MHYIDVAEDRDRWPAFENTIMNLLTFLSPSLSSGEHVLSYGIYVVVIG
jgi:hypothetical protein